MSKLIFTLICLSAFGGAIPCQTRIIYVDADANSLNNGSSWENAYNYLQDALSDANSSGKPVEIWVAQGVYRPDRGIGLMPGDRTATFRLISGVAIKGGYAGFGKPDPNARDIVKYETILSGDLDGNDVAVSDPCDLPFEQTRAENSYNVVTGSGTAATAVIDGLTIGGGNDDRCQRFIPEFCEPIASGGGMFNYNGSPTVINCTFRENAAFSGEAPHYGGGGGMFNDSNSNPAVTNCIFTANFAYNGGGMFNQMSSPILTECVFTNNGADYSGGGMQNVSSSPVLEDCIFSGNAAEIGAGVEDMWSGQTLTNCVFNGNAAVYLGGAMYEDECKSTIRGCTFSNNSAGGSGGGLRISGGTPSVAGCTFERNSAADRGGAMYISSESNPTAVNCLFDRNSSKDGGALHVYRASPHVNDCIFQENSATRDGGAMCNLSGTGANSLLVTNCLFVDNLATGKGGAIYNASNANPKVSVFCCTFSSNSATNGGAVYNKGGSTYPTLVVTVRDSILWTNTPQEIVNEGAPVVTVTYSDVKGIWPGNGNINIDPCFADTESSDYHLKSQAGRWDANEGRWTTDKVTSLCIDAGDPNSDWTAELWPHGKQINMGAYGGTSQASMSLSDAGNIADLDNNGWVDCNDLKLFTGKWLYEVFLLPEDLDRDGRTNFEDFAIFANNWLFPSE